MKVLIKSIRPPEPKYYGREGEILAWMPMVIELQVVYTNEEDAERQYNEAKSWARPSPRREALVPPILELLPAKETP